MVISCWSWVVLCIQFRGWNYSTEFCVPWGSLHHGFWRIACWELGQLNNHFFVKNKIRAQHYWCVMLPGFFSSPEPEINWSSISCQVSWILGEWDKGSKQRREGGCCVIFVKFYPLSWVEYTEQSDVENSLENMWKRESLAHFNIYLLWVCHCMNSCCEWQGVESVVGEALVIFTILTLRSLDWVPPLYAGWGFGGGGDFLWERLKYLPFWLRWIANVSTKQL